MNSVLRRTSLFLGMLAMIAVAAVACGSEPETVVVEKIVEVEKIVNVPGKTVEVKVPGEKVLVQVKVPGETVYVPADTAVRDHMIAYEEVLAKANEEGKVSVIAHSSALRRAILKDEFETRFPEITVEYLAMDNSEATARCEAEHAAGTFPWDVMMGRCMAFQFEIADTGGLQPIKDLILLPGLLEEDLWLGGFSDTFLDTQDEFIFSFGSFALSITWQRVDLLPIESITKVEQLLDPAYKGKIAMADPRTDFLANYVISFVYHLLGEEGLRTLFEDQDPTIFGTNEQLIDAMVRTDDYWLGFGFPDHRLQHFQKLGLTKAFNIEPTQWSDAMFMGRTNGTIGVPVDNPHPNATKIWVNWVLGREAQMLWSFESGEPSARTDIPSGEPLRTPDPARGTWVNFQTEEFKVNERLLNPTRDLIAKILDEQGK